MIKVFHNKKFFDYAFFNTEAPPSLADTLPLLSLVAEVDTVELEQAFRLTNTIEQGWWLNSGVRPIGKTRSTSVGDVLQHDDKYFMVAPFGFVEIS